MLSLAILVNAAHAVLLLHILSPGDPTERSGDDSSAECVNVQRIDTTRELATVVLHETSIVRRATGSFAPEGVWSMNSGATLRSTVVASVAGTFGLACPAILEQSTSQRTIQCSSMNMPAA